MKNTSGGNSVFFSFFFGECFLDNLLSVCLFFSLSLVADNYVSDYNDYY